MIRISIDFLILVMAILLIILICFGIYISIKRAMEVYQQRLRRMYIESKQKDWYHYLIQEAEFNSELIPKNKYEIQGLEEIFLVYLKNLSNLTIQEKIKQFSNQYLQKHYQKLLKSRKWSIKVNAMYRIIDFQIVSLVEECEKLEKKKLTKEENFQLLKMNSIFSTDAFINKIVNLSSTLSEYEYKKLLIGVHSETLKSLINCLDELPMPCQYSIIDTLGMNRDINDLPFLESLLQHENCEVRIRSLKAIHEIGVIIEQEKYLPFVVSEIWEERLMIAKILGNLPLAYSYPYLQILLNDESWWVRSQAAKAISNMKSGKEKLQEFIETASDRYAIDMANEYLKKGL
ncbi:MAG TPA: HEAT repeat domain-containing protein [Bacillales bacterium]|nr:HEAT repeat domain-containing protein [Bacillales bacterium]